MRTYFQLFADSWANDQTKCQNMVREHGWEKTGAVQWMALQGGAPESWVKWLEESTLSDAYACKCLSMLLAQQTDWHFKERLAKTLVAQIQPQTLVQEHMLHRCALMGHHEMFDLLLEKCPDLDFNQLNEDGLPPLALALEHMHGETCLEILKKGGLDTVMVTDPVSHKTTNVINYVMKRKNSVLTQFKSFWESVSTKFVLEKTVGVDGKSVKKGAHKKKHKL